MTTKKATPKKTSKAPAKKAPAKKAPAKKAPAKRPTKAVVKASWVEGYRPLTDALRERFGFLVRDYGFSEPEIDIDPGSALITFRRGEDFVRTESDYMSDPFTAVRAGGGEHFGLPVMMAELDPEHAAKKPAAAGKTLSPDEIRASVAHQADFLERHAGEILRGDPALLQRFKAREKAMWAAARGSG